MSLTNSQVNTLRAFVQNSADATLVSIRDRGATFELMNYLNVIASPNVPAWRKAVMPQDADDGPDYSTFDSIAAGKRESWGFFLNYARDYSRNKTRKWITDIWGNATAGSNAEAILLAGVENATVAQNAIGGTVKATGTVSALDRNYAEQVTQDECVRILAP